MQRIIANPFAKDLLQVAIIMGSGDVLAQKVTENKEFKDINWARTAKFAGLGFVFVAPALKKWYGTIDRILDQKQPHMHRVLKKVALDQLCFAPFFTVLITTAVNLLNGMALEDNKKSLKEKYIPIMKANYMLWPAVQIINFGLIPLAYQVVFVQTIALFWNTYLSMKINEKSKN